MLGKVNVGGGGSFPTQKFKIKANENIPPKSYVTLDGKLCPSEYNVSTTIDEGGHEYVDSRDTNFTYDNLVGNTFGDQIWFNEHIKIVIVSGKTNFVIYHSNGTIEIIDTGNVPYDSSYYFKSLSAINPQYFVIPCRDMVEGSTESLKYFQVYKMEGESVTLEYESSKNTSNDCCFFYNSNIHNWTYNPNTHIVHIFSRIDVKTVGRSQYTYIMSYDCSSSGLTNTEWTLNSAYSNLSTSFSSLCNIPIFVGDILFLKLSYTSSLMLVYICKINWNTNTFEPCLSSGYSNRYVKFTDDESDTAKYNVDITKNYFTKLKDNSYLVCDSKDVYYTFEWDCESFTTNGLLVSNVKQLSELKYPSLFQNSSGYVDKSLSPICRKDNEFYYLYGETVVVYKIVDGDLFIDREIDAKEFFFDLYVTEERTTMGRFSMIYDDRFVTSYNKVSKIMRLENVKHASAFCKNGGEEGSMIDVQRFI